MDRETFERYVAAFKATGLTYAKKERDRSGNATELVEISWEAALIRIMQDLQWVIVEEESTPMAYDPRPERYGHLTRLK